ncbi:MAG: 30S ribosomal protein S12 methylthiotransferase RimO [Candidatus Izemoplasmatales bacterium]|jgi:ribosomal protein S12 methylthiotransferase|nr:30S ribosomal protein S12 methylthiotransferase RimO [Candidatus Izemoplasmatales bacterium]
MKIGFISLGCAKNLVDSEMILAILENAGCEIVQNEEDADAIFVNTCGFIEPAKEESRETIKEMSRYGKKLIVVGCYAERYREQLLKEMPFIDRVITLADYPKIHLILNEVFNKEGLKFMPLKYENRLLATSKFSPYIKIGEGCNNNCTYCAIPLIRGKFRSRPIDEVVNECRKLVESGAKEINLISQDTTRFGRDLSPDKKSLLPELLKEISLISGVKMIRILYLYPDEITDELIEEVKNNPLVVPYFDIPIQHISSNVLKRMNRRGNENFIKALFKKIKDMIPEAILRTTYIVGFPGETEADFNQLFDFTEQVQFDRLGVFTYSKEEDTAAYDFEDEIPDSIKQERLDKIMKLQKKITRINNKKQVNKIHQVLVENYDPESKFYYGRSYAFAPDDIDGMIVFQSKRALAIGDFVNVLITTSYGYDLIGDYIDEVK